MNGIQYCHDVAVHIHEALQPGLAMTSFGFCLAIALAFVKPTVFHRAVSRLRKLKFSGGSQYFVKTTNIGASSMEPTLHSEHCHGLQQKIQS